MQTRGFETVTRVFDCFMFHNEFPHLSIRLRELADVVDHFILVEGTLTHTGHPKPLYFEQHKDLFREYSGKIVHRPVELPPAGKEPWFGWGREILQRSAINAALAELGAKPDDIVLSSDVDEIPRARVVVEYMKEGREDIASIEEVQYYYDLNCRLSEPTVDPKICRYLDAQCMGVADLRYCHQDRPIPVIKNGGWHLSFMGGTDKIIEKMKSYAHYDIREPKMEEFVSRENVEASVRERRSLFQRDDLKFSHVTDYSDLPKYITEHFTNFVEMGWIPDPVGLP